MSELAERIEHARRHLVPGLDPAAVERLRVLTLARARARARRAAALRVGAAVAAALLVLGALRVLVSSDPTPTPLARTAPPEERAPAATEWRASAHIAANGALSITGDASALRSLALSDEEVLIEVLSGDVHFDVDPQRDRRVHVRARDVRVEVVGTAFGVTLEDERVRVEVEHGHVRVWCGEDESSLHAGESRACRAEAHGAGDVPASPPAEVAPDELEESPRAPRRSWRALAAEGQFDEAYRALSADGEPRDDPEDLLEAADVARLSGHPRQAVAPLRRVLRRHARDPRAPLAAFTLGRVLLDELGDPQGAADAFARARQLEEDGPLAQDALAREVEARSRAGDETAARALAQEYVRRHPRGSAIRSVRRYGGLD